MKIKLIVTICFFIVMTFSNCKSSELEINSVLLCDHFNSSGECLEKKETNTIYKIKIPVSKKIKTWEELGNYLYFHARETPGVMVQFNRKLYLHEYEQMKNKYKTTYSFSGIVGVMEGREIGDHWAGSFQYLGSMLKDWAKDKNKEKTNYRLSEVFPADLSIHISTIKGDKKINTKIDLSIIEVKD